MSFFKRLLRQPLVKQALGRLAAGYLRLLRATNRFTFEVGSGVAGPPSAADPWLDARLPAIFGMWHGQHIQMSLMMRPTDRVATIISRNPDGDINTIALERLGVRVMRASGARGRRRSADTRSKGGAEGLRGMLKALKAGESVAFSADVPKITRRCDAGILTLARFAGRPIVPTAVVTSRHIRFGSWDKACLSLPFGKGAVVLGEPVFVPRECEGEEFERVRRHLEAEMDRVHVRAYALVGRHDRAAYYDAPVAPVGALSEGVA
ncbi:lysophospholipid acyltransferase family protein [Methylobacterium komagatae]